MDPETAVFWPLDPGRTLLSSDLIHVLLTRTHAVACTFENLSKICCSDRFSRFPYRRSSSQRTGRTVTGAAFRMEPGMKAFDLPLTGSIGWEAYDPLLPGCRDAAPYGAASQPQVQERGKDGFDKAAVSECCDVTERPPVAGPSFGTAQGRQERAVQYPHQ